MCDFDTEIRKAQKERQLEEYYRLKHNEKQGVYIYTMYCVWCNAYNNGEGKRDWRTFARYIKENNIAVGWWQRKTIEEKYFGREFLFDYETGKWYVKKTKQGE
jgi:hypothetical protein